VGGLVVAAPTCRVAGGSTVIPRKYFLNPPLTRTGWTSTTSSGIISLLIASKYDAKVCNETVQT
jgi:hypothetical protein